jgi:hypothetical protein
VSRVGNAYEIAKSGGRHGGIYRSNQNARIPEIEKSIRSLQKQIASHEEKIINPNAFVKNGTSDTETGYLVNSYWPKEILNFRQQMDVLNGILSERSGK